MADTLTVDISVENENPISNKYRRSSSLTAYGFCLGAQVWNKPIDKTNPIIASVDQPFDVKLFGFRKPLIIGEVYDRERFSVVKEWGKGLFVRNCPLKLNNTLEYRIPQELNQFSETLSKIISHEHAINPSVLKYFAYINVKQDIIKAGDRQTDTGYMTDVWKSKHVNIPIDRKYLVYDRVPRRFCYQSFDVAMMYDTQAKKENELDYDPYDIILYDGYSVSKDTTVDFPYCRTMMMLTYSLEMPKFDVDLNPMLIG